MNQQTHTAFPGPSSARSLLACGLSVLATVVSTGCEREQVEAPPPPPTEVTAITVEPTDTPLIFEFVGKTQSSRRVEIRSRVEGFLEERLYTEGEMVEEGQVLFQMDRKPFQAQLDADNAYLVQQEAILENAVTNLGRVKPLAEQNAVAQKELDDAEALYRTAAAAVEEAKARVVQSELDLGYTTIATPVTGLSSFAAQQEAAYIGIGTSSLLTYVAQLDPMWVEFSISENQILKGQELRREGLIAGPEGDDYVVEIILADGTVYPHTGRMTFADASLSEQTGTFLMRAEISNSEMGLRPGQFVRVQLKGAIRPNAIVIPQRAVQQAAQGSFVWVIDDAGEAEFRPVVVSSWLEDDWFVDDGLQGGETIVLDGGLKLRAGAPVTVVQPDKSEQSTATSAGGSSTEGQG